MRESPRQSMVRIAAAVGAVLGVALSLPAAAAGETRQLIRFHGGGYDRAGAITADGSGNSYVGGAVETNGRNSSRARGERPLAQATTSVDTQSLDCGSVAVIAIADTLSAIEI
jgi:hypothetical protein